MATQTHLVSSCLPSYTCYDDGEALKLFCFFSLFFFYLFFFFFFLLDRSKRKKAHKIRVWRNTKTLPLLGSGPLNHVPLYTTVDHICVILPKKKKRKKKKVGSWNGKNPFSFPFFQPHIHLRDPSKQKSLSFFFGWRRWVECGPIFCHAPKESYRLITKTVYICTPPPPIYTFFSL